MGGGAALVPPSRDDELALPESSRLNFLLLPWQNRKGGKIAKGKMKKDKRQKGKKAKRQNVKVGGGWGLSLWCVVGWLCRGGWVVKIYGVWKWC